MPKLGINRDNQKKSNRGLVIKLVATGQCTSRIELAQETGLTKTAISQIVNELILRNYLVETAKEFTRELGRKRVGLLISPEAPHYAGILVERDYCEAVLCDMGLNVIRMERTNRAWENKEELIQGIFDLLDRVLEGETNVSGIGAASIGSVDVKDGVIVRPLYFNGIRNVEIKKLLEERYGLPVAFDHDNQSAVLAEQLFGNGRGYQDILLVSVSQGVGCGILVDGKRVHSYSGYAPEIGHVSIDYRGEKCICGNVGCLERYVNSSTIKRQFREATGLDLAYEEFYKLTDRPEVDAVMMDVVEKLGTGILNALNMMNSQIVLLCQDCCYWPDKYVTLLEQRINEKKFGNYDKTVPVKKAYFMHHTQTMGAVCNIVNMAFHGEILP
ncbi:MAG: ROK family protein [Clostridiales bacterium]|nr:ROK family protein [Clostridiales bacterium]